MKKTILFLLFLGLLIGSKSFAQSNTPCNPNEEITFVNVTHAGGSFCITNCLGHACCYVIPLCGSSGGYICLDGTSGNGQSGCVALTPADFELCTYFIQISNYDGSINDNYYVSYDGTTWICTYINGSGNTYTVEPGLHVPDIILQSNGDGSLGVSLGYPDAYDDDGDYMIF